MATKICTFTAKTKQFVYNAEFWQYEYLTLHSENDTLMKEYVERLRANYRKEYNVIEVNDLPLVLLTEVINQSILHGATKLKVGFDGKVLFVHDNAAPYKDKDLLWMLSCHHEGMMSPTLRRMFRILNRQWAEPPYCNVNALCSEFKLIVSKGDKMRCIVCRDGIVVSDNVGELGIGDGNMVIMDPMIEPIDEDAEIIGEMMEQIQFRFPQVTIEYKSKA